MAGAAPLGEGRQRVEAEASDTVKGECTMAKPTSVPKWRDSEGQGVENVRRGMAKDEVYRQAEKHHSMTVAFMTSIQHSSEPDEALAMAKGGFAKYMIDYYSGVLAGTAPRSQDRFDVFRHHYEEAAEKRNYLQIIE